MVNLFPTRRVEVSYSFPLILFEWFPPRRDKERTNEDGTAIMKAARGRNFVVSAQSHRWPRHSQWMDRLDDGSLRNAMTMAPQDGKSIKIAVEPMPER